MKQIGSKVQAVYPLVIISAILICELTRGLVFLGTAVTIKAKISLINELGSGKMATSESRHKMVTMVICVPGALYIIMFQQITAPEGPL